MVKDFNSAFWGEDSLWSTHTIKNETAYTIARFVAHDSVMDFIYQIFDE